ncbi:MAG: GAF domain-containing protein [Thermoanaerobaculia bacterium]
MRKSPGRQESTDGRSADIAAFRALLRSVIENRQFPDAAQSVLKACRENLGAESGFVALRPRGGEGLDVVIVDPPGVEMTVASGLPSPLRRLSIRASQGLRAVAANHLASDPDSAAKGTGSFVIENALIAPVVLGGELAGLLCVMNAKGGFSAADSGLGEVYAELAAVALHHSLTVNDLEIHSHALEEERHAGAAQLWQSEREFRTLVENLPDVIARFDADLRHLYVSPTIQRLTGRPAEEFVGKTNLELGMPPDVTQQWNASIKRVLATGRPERLEFEFPSPDATRHFDCRLVAERGPDGKIQSVLSVARDVTERWLAYEAEKRARTVADALRETTVLLTRSLDRETVLSTMLDCLRRLVPFDRARVMMLEAESRVSVRAIFDGKHVVPLEAEVRPEFDPDDHPIVRDILTTGTAVLIPDIRTRADWSLPTDGSMEVSWMGVPLYARGDVAGLFSLSKSEPDYFNEEHVRLAEAMSTQASVAVENSVLFEQMQVSTQRLQALSRRIVEVQESERRHIARELHDEAGQALVSLRYGLRMLERQIDLGESVTERVSELVNRTDAVIDGLHRLAADLRPASLDHLGLEAALRQYSRSAGTETGLAVRFKARGFTDDRLEPAIETALYRVVQEAVANVVRHARATGVDIFVRHRGDSIMVMIEDDGVGFEERLVPLNGHFGLLGMRERAAALGGTLTVESTPGAGTTIVVEVPIDNPNSDR